MNPEPASDAAVASATNSPTNSPDAASTPASASNATECDATLGQRVTRELLSWLWVALAFFLITGTMVQARVIPSGSMENTLLVGDHLLMSRLGYDATVPFTRLHMRLWREPHRQQVIIFRAPLPGSDEDFIKRLIAVPGDTVEIRAGVVFVNGRALSEPYRNGPPDAFDNYGRVTVPAHNFFVLGDNRDDSYDSRYWGFVPEANILGTPVVIYMSVEASEDAWQPGQVRERFHAYLSALLHPSLVRWRRLFKTF
jgi:signal peptidase I